MAEPTAADVRAVAVARLKRAASLPRMKDGRRPPMHDDAVSEGDKGNNAEGAQSDEVTDAEHPPVPIVSKEEEPTVVEDESQVSGRDTPSKSKRRGRSRSRSRSRSRGSKDFKEAIAKANELNRPMDSSPEEQLPPIPFFTPVLVSPIPSPFTAVPIHPRAFFSPPSPSPHHFLHSPNSPPPSLDALRAGLIRSNSARVLAMNKLTGGRESPTNAFASSPSPTPPAPLVRSNTVTGVERSAARNLMLKRLEKRAPAKDGAESEITSGAEDRGVDSSSSGHSKRASPSLSNAVIDDRDPTNTAPTSPLEPPTSLPAPDIERQNDINSTNANGDDTFGRHSPLKRALPPGPAVHGIVIEEDIEDDSVENPTPQSSRLHSNGLPATPPARNPSARPQMSESSTSSMSTNTDTERIPVFLHEHGQKSPYTRDDTFPVTISPMSTLVRESDIRDEDEGDGDDEKVVFLYPEEMRERKAYLGRMENNISWIGEDDGINLNYSEANHSTFHEARVSEDDEEDGEPLQDGTVTVDPPPQESQGASEVPFPQAHSDADEGNLSRGTSPSILPETPSSALTFPHAPSNSEKGDTPLARASVASSSNSAMILPSLSPLPVARPDRGHSDTFTDWEEVQTDREGLTDRESSHRFERSPSRKKRESGSTSASKWERVKTTLTGRRSRSNSFARSRKEEKAETSVSRESGASAKTDIGAANGSPSSQISQGQTHSSAASMLSLAASPVPPSRGGLSPVPPFSATMAKYNDPKLMPLPGLFKLEEERRTRHRRLSLSASGDGLSPTSGTVPNTRVNSPEPGLVHQASDSRLLARYRSSGEAISPGESSGREDRPITPGFFNIPPSPSAPKQLTLPQTKEAALRWLTQRKKDGRVTPQPSINGHSNGSASDTGTVRQHGKRKPSLTDLLSERVRGNDSGTERDERADRTTSVTPRAGSRRKAAQEYLRRMTGSPTMESSHSHSISTSSIQSAANDRAPTPVRTTLEVNGNGHASISSSSPSSSHPSPLPQQSSPSPSNHQLPQSQSQTQSYSNPHTPSPPPAISSVRTSKSSFVLQRLDSILNGGDSSSVRGSASLGTPPRQLILSTFARQIVSPNEVKNRLLLLFNDILIIAKFNDEEVVQPPLNRTLLVRNVVELHKIGLQIHSDQVTPDFMQLSPIKTFVRQFPSGPDEAIAQCIERSKLTPDPPTIGNLLYRSIGLDSVVLGQYLSRRSNKAVLRAYLDRFGFKGMRIDLALRVFLLTMHLPSEPTTVEHLLATFASRWFDANKGVVTFDRDLATRLVLAIIQLNSAVHPDGLDNAQIIRPSNSHILARDFVHAFRSIDAHSLVTDDLLQKIYISIRNEKLVQALAPTDRDSEIQVTLPVPIPEKLTARVASSPITIKIPHPDPNFRVHLHGPDLFFDPPVLDFSRSNEASFVIVGSTLGTKDMIMARSGANAARYSSLPLTRSILVERSFMRNTFTVGFVSPAGGVRRKYRFNISEDEEYQQWRSLLRRYIHERVAESSASQSSSGTASARVQQAAEKMAVQVLRDAIIPPGALPDPRPASNGTSESSGSKKAGPVVGHELVVMCVQNSLIPVVLTLLQVTRHPDAEPTGVGGMSRHINGNGNGNGKI